LLPNTTDNGSAISQLNESPQLPQANELARQPSRTSGRARPNVNYTTMAAGTGEISANLDYNEVSGQNLGGGKNSGQRPKGVKVNHEILKKS